MSQPVDTREVRVIDQFGFDITDRIVADYGSIEAWREFGAQARALLFDGVRRATERIDTTA